MSPEEVRVWETVVAMNRQWTRGEPEALNEYFHEKMVAIVPNTFERLVGKEACVAGWTDFCQQATIHAWIEKEPLLQLWGTMAIVTYYYEMVFEMKGQTIETAGRDMMTLIQEAGKWWVVADQFSSCSNGEVLSF